MPGVRDAAVALIGVAPESTVLTVLRMLVDAVTPTSARSPQAPSQVVHRPVPVPRQSAAAAAAIATQPATDAAWEAMRLQVKAAMAERGASYGDIAQSIGRSEIGTRITINTRKPPKPVVRARLQNWINQAPAVAAAPVPFPGSSAEHRSNGSDHPSGAYSSATA